MIYSWLASFWSMGDPSHWRVQSCLLFTCSEETNVIEAGANGASVAGQTVVAVLVNFIAFLSLLAFINATLSWIGGRVGFPELSFEVRDVLCDLWNFSHLSASILPLRDEEYISCLMVLAVISLNGIIQNVKKKPRKNDNPSCAYLQIRLHLCSKGRWMVFSPPSQVICSYLFWPLALMIGIEVPYCREVAKLIGIKVFTSEILAYQELGESLKGPLAESVSSLMIMN